jgi:hypothetical protein
MTVKAFRSAWTLVKNIKSFRSGIGWTDIKNIRAWRDPNGDNIGFWDLVYPDLPISSVTPFVSGTGEPGTTFSLSNNQPWVNDGYVRVQNTTYQWARSTTSGGPYTNVSGATSSTYNIQSSDLNNYFICRITGTNAKGSTTVNSSQSLLVSDPNYTFNFLQEFGVNANAMIIFDKTNNVFPDTDILIISGRVLAYFFGDYKHFDLWYRSDATTFRLYHRMYRNDRTTRPSTPDIEYEIVFTNGSRVVDIFVINPIATQYILDDVAYLKDFFQQFKSYNIANYAAGRRFRVTMDSTTGIFQDFASPSTTSPSFTDGWIYISSGNDSTTGTITFSSLQNFPSPLSPAQTFVGPYFSFNKSNMFFPRSVTINNVSYSSTTQASVSWSYGTSSPLNGTSYTIEVLNSSQTSVLSTQNTTLTSATVSGLTVGTSYVIRVTPNSRSDFFGQYGFPTVSNYLHATVPGAPTGVTGTSGNTQVALSWTAPTSNGGSNITGYKIRYSTNGGVSWLPATPISTGSTTTSFTVTGLTNGTSYIFQVLATNAIGDGAWSSSSSSVTPQAVASRIGVTVSPASVQTLSQTATFTAQLQDNATPPNNVSISGRSITFTLNPAAGGSINTTSGTTDANGRAQVTFTSGSLGGTATVTATSTGLTQGSADLTVTLRDALNPTITGTSTTKGVSFSNTNRDAAWTYSNWIGPTVGTLESGDSYNNAQFDILVPRVKNQNPSLTVNRTVGSGGNAETTDTTFNANRSVSIQLISSRSGYASGFSNSATATAGVSIDATRSYQWQQFTNGTWNTSFGTAFSGMQTFRLSWSNRTFTSRQIRCRVTTTFSDGTSDISFSNEPTIP